MRDKVYKTIAIDKIVPNVNQPRTVFDDEKIEELAASIKHNGLLQPIIVRKYNGEYQIIAGERRYRACRLAGIKDIPCLITKYDDQQVDTLAIIENIQRENLSVIEEAKAYQTLMQIYQYNQTELAEKVGKKQSTIANKLRLLKLSKPVQDALSANKITERHGRAMLGLEDNEQEKLLDKVIDKSFTVKQTEQFIEKEKKPKKTNKSISQNVKIAVNTIKQATKMIEKTGITLEESYEDKDNEFIITIKVKK
ncbi:MAG: nucleoid occlusion protein [Coprobacillaceae bacterium]